MHTQFTVRNIVHNTQSSNLDGFVIGVTCFSEKPNCRYSQWYIPIPLENGIHFPK
jgi:hypothetical protein